MISKMIDEINFKHAVLALQYIITITRTITRTIISLYYININILRSARYITSKLTKYFAKMI